MKNLRVTKFVRLNTAEKGLVEKYYFFKNNKNA